MLISSGLPITFGGMALPQSRGGTCFAVQVQIIFRSGAVAVPSLYRSSKLIPSNKTCCGVLAQCRQNCLEARNLSRYTRFYMCADEHMPVCKNHYKFVYRVQELSKILTSLLNHSTVRVSGSVLLLGNSNKRSVFFIINEHKRS
jgi:hypothetical protein